MSKVSILVPTYNCSKYLPKAIESALKQTYQDFEIIIINDGSTDNTADIVQQFVNNNPGKIKYIYQENKGLAVARNTGLDAASGEYIALLDADDCWLPHRLADGVKIMQANPDVGLVHGNITRISPTDEIIDTPIRETQYLNGHIFENIYLRKAHISCPTVLFRKECCKTAGVFDPELTRLGCEDRDLWLRIAKKYKFLYLDQVLSYYRVSDTSMSQNVEKMTKARLYVIDKYCPPNAQDKTLRNKALAKIYHDLGDYFLLKKNYSDARSQYGESLKYNVFRFWTWLNILKSILGK